MKKSSSRETLRSSAIFGSTQLVTIVVGLLKFKAVALILGPTGVGILGLYLSVMQTFSTVASFGLGSVGTRQIVSAQVDGGENAVGRTRRSLFWGTLLLGLIGACIFWISSEWISKYLLSDKNRVTEVKWLAIGIALTVATGSQLALLRGFRRVGDIATINVAASVLGAGFGIMAVWFFGEIGLVALVLIAPAVTFSVGLMFVNRIGPPAGPSLKPAELAREWRIMVGLGFPFMLSTLVTTSGLLLVRSSVQRELGTDALGHFQAAWIIGATYLSLVLGAMGTDYYPRLVAVIRDPHSAVDLVNEQTEIALLILGPMLLALLGSVSWVVQLLYSPQFGPAADILRWQLLGDILKVMSWPLSFVILAAGAGKTYILTETLGMCVFVAVAALFQRHIGVTATGLAFLASYSVYLPVVWWVSARRIGFYWSRAVRFQALLLLAAACIVVMASRHSESLGLVCGFVGATMMGVWALMRLSSMTGATGHLGRLAALVEKLRKLLRVS